MERLRCKLQSIYEETGRKVDVVTHSMGGLLFKSFVALHKEDVAKYVSKWVAIAAPFRGEHDFEGFQNRTLKKDKKSEFKSFVALHKEDVAKYVSKWVAIAAPFRGECLQTLYPETKETRNPQLAARSARPAGPQRAARSEPFNEQFNERFNEQFNERFNEQSNERFNERFNEQFNEQFNERFN